MDTERRVVVVVIRRSGFDPRSEQACYIIRCKNLDLNIRDCVYLCLSEDALKTVGPFYRVSMPREVKYPTQEANV